MQNNNRSNITYNPSEKVEHVTSPFTLKNNFEKEILYVSPLIDE